MTSCRIAIVGSRRRRSLPDRDFVFRIVEEAIKKFGSENVTVVSGGCPTGADAFAKEAASIRGTKYLEFPIPRDPPIRDKWDFTQRAYGRNGFVAENCDIMYALVHRDRTGGTEDTVKKSLRLLRPTWLVGDDLRLTRA